MNTVRPTKKDIEDLVSYLPILYNDEIVLYKTAEKYIGNGYYSYHSEVLNFVELASKPCWLDKEYLNKSIDEIEIENASLEEISTLLTFFHRKERFYEGNMAIMISEKIIKRILERLIVILKETY